MKYAEKRNLPPGFTLVEIMVAMLITLIVMGGVYQTLTEETVSQERKEKILDMQNNARVALERIARDVRRSGFLGCGGTLAADTLMHSVQTPTTFVQRYTVAKNLIAPAPPGLDRAENAPILPLLKDLAAGGTDVNFLGEVMGFFDNAPPAYGIYQEGTDAISLVYLSEERVWDRSVSPTANQFSLETEGFEDGDILYITDCLNYSLFQKTNGTSKVVEHIAEGLNVINNINSADPAEAYATTRTPRVFKLNVGNYFIHGDGSYELCHNTVGRQIASNIEDLQFEFLADEDDDGNLSEHDWRTDPAAYPTGADAVRAVRIWVLAMSEPDYGYTDALHMDPTTSTLIPNYYNYPNSPYCDPAPAVPFTFVCSGTGTPASKAPIASPPDGENRHRYLASAVVYLRNAGLN